VIFKSARSLIIDGQHPRRWGCRADCSAVSLAIGNGKLAYARNALRAGDKVAVAADTEAQAGHTFTLDDNHRVGEDAADVFGSDGLPRSALQGFQVLERDLFVSRVALLGPDWLAGGQGCGAGFQFFLDPGKFLRGQFQRRLLQIMHVARRDMEDQVLSVGRELDRTHRGAREGFVRKVQPVFFQAPRLTIEEHRRSAAGRRDQRQTGIDQLVPRTGSRCLLVEATGSSL
jgi:hypothetical protein